MIGRGGEKGHVVRRIAVVPDRLLPVVVVDHRAGAVSEIPGIGELDPERPGGEVEILDRDRAVDHEIRALLHIGELAVRAHPRISGSPLPANPAHKRLAIEERPFGVRSCNRTFSTITLSRP